MKSLRAWTQLTTLSALACAAPAAAEPLKTVPAALDPAKAYVLVEYRLEKNPYADLPGSRKTLPMKNGMVFARYDPALGDVRGMGKAKANPVPKPQQPIEGFRNRPLVKAPGSRLFLLELEPDVWVIQGWGGTSFSLGSYSLALEPGTITDLGVVTAEPDWAEGDRPSNGGDVIKAAFLGPFAKRPDIAPMRLSFRARGAADLPVPAGLPTDRVRPAAFTEGARFGNHLGGLVNRVDGVNARLKRDTGGEAEAAPAPSVTQ